jgi:hypothetical protein
MYGVAVLGGVNVAETFCGAAGAHEPGPLQTIPKDKKLPSLRKYFM